jgi:hypothetical protein
LGKIWTVLDKVWAKFGHFSEAHIRRRKMTAEAYPADLHKVRDLVIVDDEISSLTT